MSSSPRFADSFAHVAKAPAERMPKMLGLNAGGCDRSPQSVDGPALLEGCWIAAGPRKER